MKKLFFSLLTFLLVFYKAFGAQTDIILINSEAFLVEYNEEHEIIKTYEKVSEYFTTNLSHNLLVAKYEKEHRYIGHHEEEALNETKDRTKNDEELCVERYSTNSNLLKFSETHSFLSFEVENYDHKNGESWGSQDVLSTYFIRQPAAILPFRKLLYA